MLHYYAKKFFAPTALSMAIESGNLTIYLIQDVVDPVPHKLTLYCFSWNSFSAKYIHEVPVKLVCSACKSRKMDVFCSLTR